MSTNAHQVAKPLFSVAEQYYYHVDVIRFSSAVLVMIFHFGYLDQVANFKIIWPVTWFGWVGVEVFFVISGFVIANSAHGADAKQFLRGRLLRLYPAAWLCATISFVANAGSSDLFLPYLRSLTLIPKGPWISPVYWTLAVEISFYSLILMLLFCNKFTLISQVAAVLTTLSAIYDFGITLMIWKESDHFNILLLRHGCFFSIGIWIWLSTTRTLKLWERLAIIVAIITCVSEIRLVANKFIPLASLDKHVIIVPIVVWCFAVGAIWILTKTTVSVGVNVAKFLRLLGLITYPLYLVHDVIGRKVMEGLILISVNKWVALTFTVVFMLFVCWIIVKFERRIRIRFASILDRLDLKLSNIYVNSR